MGFTITWSLIRQANLIRGSRNNNIRIKIKLKKIRNLEPEQDLFYLTDLF